MDRSLRFKWESGRLTYAVEVKAYTPRGRPVVLTALLSLEPMPEQLPADDGSCTIKMQLHNLLCSDPQTERTQPLPIAQAKLPTLLARVSDRGLASAESHLALQICENSVALLQDSGDANGVVAVIPLPTTAGEDPGSHLADMGVVAIQTEDAVQEMEYSAESADSAPPFVILPPALLDLSGLPQYQSAGTGQTCCSCYGDCRLRVAYEERPQGVLIARCNLLDDSTEGQRLVSTAIDLEFDCLQGQLLQAISVSCWRTAAGRGTPRRLECSMKLTYATDAPEKPTVSPIAVESAPTPLTEPEFQKFCTSLNSSHTSRQQLLAIGALSDSTWLSGQQVITLLDTLPQDLRLEALRLVRSSVINLEEALPFIAARYPVLSVVLEEPVGPAPLPRHFTVQHVEEAPIYHVGKLLKKGTAGVLGFGGEYREREFILEGFALKYQGGARTAIINLKGSTVQEDSSRQFGFTISGPFMERKFYLAALNISEMETWIQLLRRAARA